MGGPGKRGARGVRLNPEHDERTRAHIQTTHLINRLQSFVNSKVELQPHQVTAALGLLKKTMPDLAAIEHSGEVKQTYIVSPKLPNEEWEEKYVTKHLDS